MIYSTVCSPEAESEEVSRLSSIRASTGLIGFPYILGSSLGLHSETGRFGICVEEYERLSEIVAFRRRHRSV
jgi:hypothetical protein